MGVHSPGMPVVRGMVTRIITCARFNIYREKVLFRLTG